MVQLCVGGGMGTFYFMLIGGLLLLGTATDHSQNVIVLHVTVSL